MSIKTKSEEIFEAFLEDHKIPFERISEDTSPRPDYVVSIDGTKLIFELKELSEDQAFGVIEEPGKGEFKSYSRILGDHVRRRIEDARKQVQYGAKQGIPSILLIYNNLDRVFQMFGTEDMDFITAMYGELTVIVNKETRETSELFNGRNQSLRHNKNNCFSAVGRLCNRGAITTVTLFENTFSPMVKLPVDLLPPCFEVRRVSISEDPLIVP